MSIHHQPPTPRFSYDGQDGCEGNYGGGTQVTIDQHSPLPARIALFCSLFRGREDIYPRRFESLKTGRSGYQPVCGNEWARNLCDKRQVRCAECPNRHFLPVTDEAIQWHLSGRDASGRDFVMGVYPMLQDETCFFLAADFDKKSWCEDAEVFLETCRRFGVCASLERSRSGNGGHVWLFFDEAVPAGLARKLGSYILTEAMEQRPDIGFDSYDRFFPNQDTLPNGGFGNLIALPLQKRAAEHGNSLFVDKSFNPYPDQWMFLSGIAKINRSMAEELIRDGEGRGRVVGIRLVSTEEDDAMPWNVPPSRRRKEPTIVGSLPESMELILGNEIYISKEFLPPGLHNRLLRLAAFQNPEFYKTQAMRLPTYGTPRIIGCAEDYPHHIGLPRGCLEDLTAFLIDLNIRPVLRDERCSGTPLNISFNGELRTEQKAAAEALASHDIGVLSATTAFGKTVVAAWLIAERHVNTLVLVHRRQLLEQWVERLSTFLTLPAKAIGRIGGGQKKPMGNLDVALLQSLVRKGVVDDRVGEYGHLVVDECHHLSAHSFEQVARRAKARFVTGLSATVTRKDGHHPIIFMQCGPVRHSVSAKEQAVMHPFDHAVHVRPTGFWPLREADPDPRSQFQDLYGELAMDDARNNLICEDVMQAVREGRSPIVLTERREHLDRLEKMLSPHVRYLIALRGGMNRKELSALADRLNTVPDCEERVLLATGRYIGEGFDDARLDTLFLALPVSWRGTIAQYAGRLHRLHDRKHEVRVYDYADLNVPMLAKMFDRRCRGYEAIGYSIFLPASAIPGWPADVPLPSDPQWKRDYAASIRRLVRDGVDKALATLFVQAVHTPVPRQNQTVLSDIEGISQARSATEIFLFRRLQTMPATMGKFRLNTELPIPFDGWGHMEIDLLCPDARIAIELDGDQHLSDRDAYRRDRRKDILLQENNYLVLRFLAEDVGTHLDLVLDTIFRALANRLRR